MKRWAIWLIGWLLLLCSVYLTATQLDRATLFSAGQTLLGKPQLLLLMTVGYGLAFWLRSWAWHKQLRHQTGIKRLWYYHHIGLLLNHLLPVKGGELARIALLRRYERLDWSESVVSVAGSRFVDMAGLLFLSVVALVFIAPHYVQRLYSEKMVWLTGLLAIFLVLMLAAALIVWRSGRLAGFTRLLKYWNMFRQLPHWLPAFFLTAAGWLLEGVVVWSVVYGLEGQLTVPDALLVHVLTIMGQTFHVTPGGLGTYEAVMSALLHQVADLPLSFALQVAILTHGFKFVYSFLVGGFAAWRLSLSPLVFFRQAKAESRKGNHEKSIKI